MQPMFFGARWNAPIVAYAERVATPVGQPCYDCAEAVEEGDRGFLRSCIRVDDDGNPVGSIEPIHAECDLRGVLGHQLGICHCTGHEPSRDTARLVWQAAGMDGDR